MLNHVSKYKIYLNYLEVLDIVKKFRISIQPSSAILFSTTTSFRGGVRLTIYSSNYRHLIANSLTKNYAIDILNTLQELYQYKLLDILGYYILVLLIIAYQQLGKKDSKNIGIETINYKLLYIVEQGLIYQDISLPKVVYIYIQSRILLEIILTTKIGFYNYIEVIKL